MNFSRELASNAKVNKYIHFEGHNLWNKYMHTCYLTQ
jgi:hypothetical protein